MGLGPAIVAAVVGAALAVGLIGRFAVEVRARSVLRSTAPDFSAFDADVQRYLERVWLMIGAWKPRLTSKGAADADALWVQVLDAASTLQTSRAAGAEVADQVAELVRLEAKIEAHIAETVSA